MRATSNDHMCEYFFRVIGAAARRYRTPQAIFCPSLESTYHLSMFAQVA
jgi:hypothetical protein